MQRHIQAEKRRLTVGASSFAPAVCALHVCAVHGFQLLHFSHHDKTPHNASHMLVIANDQDVKINDDKESWLLSRYFD